MANYILRRLLLIVPTLFGIMVINFLVVQSAPGGPVEQMIAKIQGHDLSATARIAVLPLGIRVNHRATENNKVLIQRWLMPLKNYMALTNLCQSVFGIWWLTIAS